MTLITSFRLSVQKIFYTEGYCAGGGFCPGGDIGQGVIVLEPNGTKNCTKTQLNDHESQKTKPSSRHAMNRL